MAKRAHTRCLRPSLYRKGHSLLRISLRQHAESQSPSFEIPSSFVRASASASPLMSDCKIYKASAILLATELEMGRNKQSRVQHLATPYNKSALRPLQAGVGPVDASRSGTGPPAGRVGRRRGRSPREVIEDKYADLIKQHEDSRMRKSPRKAATKAVRQAVGKEAATSKEEVPRVPAGMYQNSIRWGSSKEEIIMAWRKQAFWDAFHEEQSATVPPPRVRDLPPFPVRMPAPPAPLAEQAAASPTPPPAATRYPPAGDASSPPTLGMVRGQDTPLACPLLDAGGNIPDGSGNIPDGSAVMPILTAENVLQFSKRSSPWSVAPSIGVHIAQVPIRLVDSTLIPSTGL